jgi:Autotransporter beta-domain
VSWLSSRSSGAGMIEGSSSRLSSYQFTAYGTWRPDRFDGRLTVDGQAGFAYNSYNQFREIQFSVPDVRSRQLFVALCRRYGISPFRYRRMHRQTVIVKAPRSFIDQVLWPEFQDLSAALSAYLSEITEKLIREEVHGETADAEERDEPKQLTR